MLGISEVRSMSFESEPWGSWQNTHIPEATGECRNLLENLPLLWQSKHKYDGSSNSRFLFKELWGLWQELHLPSTTGACRDLLSIMDLSWQRKHKAGCFLTKDKLGFSSL
jgi:hypothetical protein